MTESKRIIVGKILGAHGIRGEVKLASYMEDPRAIGTLPDLRSEDGGRLFKLTIRGQGKDHLIASLEGVTDRNTAETLKGILLSADRAALPKLADEKLHYQEDLLGLEVRLKDESVFGIVASVQNFGASDILEIKREGQKQTEMFAFTEANFPEVHVGKGWLLLDLPEEI